MSREILNVPSALEGVEFANKGLQPPSNVYIGPDDAIFITAYGSTNALRVDVRARLLLANGRDTVAEFSALPPSDRTATTTVYALGQGWMLNASVFLGSGSCKRGQCYVVVGICRGVGSSRFAHTILMQGYVGTGLNRAWPGDRLEQPLEGPGYMRGIPGTDPAPGVEISEVVPTGARWRLVSLGATFVTDATVINRVTVLSIDIGSGSPFWRSISTLQQAQSLSNDYYWGTGVSWDTLSNNSFRSQGLPVNLFMTAAWRLRTTCVNLQAGDNWSAPLYFVEEWLEP